MGPVVAPGMGPAPGTRRVRKPPVSSDSGRSGANLGALAALTASAAAERSPLPHSAVLNTPAAELAGAGAAVANPAVLKLAAAS